MVWWRRTAGKRKEKHKSTNIYSKNTFSKKLEVPENNKGLKDEIIFKENTGYL